MRRPPVACRRAVQSLQTHPPQHVWISEDLLSGAIHRFFRISCPHQKRHGSHVPGPLEARRRAAKRRMSLSADYYPQESFTSPFSLGTLFGLRSNPKPSWKYEPPSLPKYSEPLDMSEDTSRTPSPEAADAARAYPSQSAHDAVSAYSQHVPHTCAEQHDMDESDSTIYKKVDSRMSTHEVFAIAKNAFKAFQSRIAEADNLSCTDRGGLLVEAFKACYPPYHAWKYNTMVVREVLQRRWDPKAILERLSDPDLRSDVPIYFQHECLDLLYCLEKFTLQYPHCVSDILQICISLAHTATTASRNPYQDTRLMALVRHLWRSARLQGVDFDPSSLNLLQHLAQQIWSERRREALSKILANTVNLKSQLLNLIAQAAEDTSLVSTSVDVMMCIPTDRLSKEVITIASLYAWEMAYVRKKQKNQAQTPHRLYVLLQLIQLVEVEVSSSDHTLAATVAASLAQFVFKNKTAASKHMATLLISSLANASSTAAFEDVPMSKITDFLTTFDAKAGQNDSPRTEPVLGIFMSHVREKNLPHDAVIQTIVDAFVRHAGLEETLKVLGVLDRRQLVLPNDALVRELIVQKLTYLQIRNGKFIDASELQVCANALDLLDRISSTVDDLKAEVDTLEAHRQFQHILDRARDDHVLPLAYRNISVTCSPEERAMLIHQLAHQYATSVAYSQRAAWRSVIYLYRHLQQHSLPIGSLFTKAVVRILIIRSMAENRFVSAERLVWVCELVAKVEGEEVAKQIEPLFWHWRGDVIQRAKDAYINSGGDRQDKAYVSMMKRLGLV